MMLNYELRRQIMHLFVNSVNEQRACITFNVRHLDYFAV